MSLKRLVETSVEEEVKMREFIMGGGLVPSDLKSEQNEQQWTKINLRIQRKALELIDEQLSKRMSGTRTSWILEAIQEKLER